MSYQDDPLWVETKKTARANGFSGNAIEMAAFYRELGGQNVFIYSLVPKNKRLIITVMEDDSVLLLDKNNELITEAYEDVLQSKKKYKYNELHTIQAFSLQTRDEEITLDIPIEIHEKGE